MSFEGKTKSVYLVISALLQYSPLLGQFFHWRNILWKLEEPNSLETISEIEFTLINAFSGVFFIRNGFIKCYGESGWSTKIFQVMLLQLHSNFGARGKLQIIQGVSRLL